MNRKDESKPIPNLANKPMPESERGIADVDDPNADFRGEPDTGSSRPSGVGGSGSSR